jgi:holo-[acyl-carrier protein] synthase
MVQKDRNSEIIKTSNLIKGIGIDLCSLSRIRKLMDDYDSETLEYLFTKKEFIFFNSCNRPDIGFSIAFSIKEAVGKALQTGMGKLNWYEIETVFNNKDNNVMQIALYGSAQNAAKKKFITNWVGSWSSVDDFIVTIVVGY